MTTPNEQAPATRSEWLALIREAVRLEMAEQRRVDPFRPDLMGHAGPVTSMIRPILAPQPPSEG